MVLLNLKWIFGLKNVPYNIQNTPKDSLSTYIDSIEYVESPRDIDARRSTNRRHLAYKL